MPGKEEPISAPNGTSASQERQHALLGHDLRSAVGDVLGGLQMIDDRCLDAESLMQLERVRAAGETVARLVSEVLTDLCGEASFSVEVGDSASYALIDLIRDLERRWIGHAAAEGLKVTADLAHDLPIMIGTDRTMLERVLSNLLDNAVNYADIGTVTLAVDMRSGDELRFTVRDEGPGFSAAALARLFDFGGRPAAAARPGTGMGLHIAKGLVDRIGGRLLVSNICDELDAMPRGAQVTLLLPAEAWRPAGWAQDEGTLPDLSGKTVLIAEDNPTNQLVLSRMLAHMGADVRVTEDGREAFEVLRNGGVDLALIDIEMPRMSGTEVIARTRRLNGPESQVPILAVTAYVLRNYREEIYRAGADGIIAKPVMSLAAFGLAISSLIRRSASMAGETPSSPAILRPSVSPPTTGHLDQARLDHLLEIAGPEGRDELLSRLQADIAHAASGLASGIASHDLVGVRAHTHVLISLSGAVGAITIQARMEAMNDAAHRSNWAAVEAGAKAAQAGLQTLLAELEAAARQEGDSIAPAAQ